LGGGFDLLRKMVTSPEYSCKNSGGSHFDPPLRRKGSRVSGKSKGIIKLNNDWELNVLLDVSSHKLRRHLQIMAYNSQPK